MFVVLVSNLYLHMFTYSVDITSHHILYISVLWWHKCCASRNNMFYVFFCLIAHPTFTIIWLLHDVSLMITRILCFSLGCYFKLSVCPFKYELHNHARVFGLLMIFQGPDRIVHVLVSSWVLLCSHTQCWTEVDFLYFGQQFLVSYILLYWFSYFL